MSQQQPDLERNVPVTFKTSARIARALKIASAKSGKTQRRLLHEGLLKLGFDIRDEDLVEKRGRPKKSAPKKTAL